MYAMTWSTVVSVGEQPSRSSRTRFGSPTACRPSVVGPNPVRSRNPSTCDTKSSVSVSMRGTVETLSQVRQPVGFNRCS